MKLKSSKLVAFLLTFIALLSQLFFSSSAFAADIVTPKDSTNPDTVPVTIFHTNDMHGRLAYEEYKGTPTSYGVAKEKALIEKEKAENPDRATFILDAGDAFQGLPISNESKGEDMAKAMNAIGYEAIAAGNHEFDFGFDTVEKYRDSWLKFPMLSSNTYKDGKLVFKPSTIIEKNGLKVGIVGVTTPETATKTNPVGIVGVSFAKPIPAVKNAIQEIKDKVDFVTVLSHLGDDTTTLNDEKGSSLAKALAEDPAFAKLSILVIDGHSHQVIQNDFNNVHQAQTGAYLANVGKITFDFDKVNKKFVNYKSEMLSAKENAKDLTPDKALTEIVKVAQDKFDVKGKEFLFHNKTKLEGESKYVRTKETNLGNIIADALEKYDGFKNKSDFAVTNGGGIRTTLNADTDITLGDVIKVLPFGNLLTQITVKGSDVKAMYEHSLRAAIDKDENGKNVLDEQGKPQLGSNGGFLHSSSSIKVYFDPEKKAGERVLKIEVLNKETNKFEELKLDKNYHMATNDFLAVGGDGYTMLGGVREESGSSMDRVVADYLKSATTSLDMYSVVFPYSRIIPGLLPVVKPDNNKEINKPQSNSSNNTNKDNDNLQLNMSNNTNNDTAKESSEVKTTSTSLTQKALPKTGMETSSSAAGVIVLASMILVLIKRKVK